MAETNATPLPVDPPTAADERMTLITFVDFYRDVFIRKVEGLDDEQARVMACPPSDLTPLGMVRHMAEVERQWLRRHLGESDVDALFDYSVDHDHDFHPDADATLAEAIESWHTEVAAARANIEQFELDDLLTARREHERSVRWMLVHMIEEYARHCGHLDLICEAIDGRTGD